MKNKIKANCGVEGWYTLAVGKLDAEGNLVPRQTIGPFKNVITNQGLNRMGDSGSWFSYCQVGEGSSTPTVTDTSLDIWVAGTNNATSNTGAVGVNPPEYYARRRRTYRFNEGEAAGNLTEVGVGWGADSSTLYSRALIVDGGGTPITITVLSDEILDVTYEHRIYPPLDDVIGTITISGDDYDYILRACNVTSSTDGFGPGWGLTATSTGVAAGLRPNNTGHSLRSGDIADITSIPSGSIAAAGTLSQSNPAYVSESLEKVGVLTWGLGTAGLTPVRCAVYCFYWAAFQIQFDPPLPKSNENILTLTFVYSWSRRTI